LTDQISHFKQYPGTSGQTFSTRHLDVFTLGARSW